MDIGLIYSKIKYMNGMKEKLIKYHFAQIENFG